MFHEQIQILLNKPMDRREFLKTAAKLCLLITGVSALLQGLMSLNGSKPQRTNVLNPSRHGFGSSKFGV